MKKTIHRKLLLSAILATFGADATEFTVSEPQDDGTGLVAQTLSWAILQANTEPGEDVITLQTDVLITGVMKRLIDSDVTIQSDPTVRTISGNNQFRPLFIKSGQVNLNRFVISNGSAQGGASMKAGAGAGLGGGLFIYDGAVNLSAVTITNSSAMGGENMPGNSYEGGGMFGNALFDAGGLFDLNGYYGGYGLYQTVSDYFGQGSVDFNRDGGFGGGGASAFGSYYDIRRPSDGGFGGGGGAGSSYNGVEYATRGRGGFGAGFGGYGSAALDGAGMGGGLFVRSGEVRLSHVTITNNSANAPVNSKGLGGGLFILHSTTLNSPQMPDLLPVFNGCASSVENNVAKTIDAAGSSTDDYFDLAGTINAAWSITLTGACLSINGNNQWIETGDMTPNSADLTHFGVVELNNNETSTRQFSISNHSLDSISLTQNPAVQITGPNASDFTVISWPDSTIDSDETSDFEVRFMPTEPGYKEALLSIGYDDSGIGVYQFKIDGQGIDQSPELELRGNGQTINTLNAPAIMDGTDFGGQVLEGGEGLQTFEVINSGNLPLSINGQPQIEISGPDADSFEVQTGVLNDEIQPGSVEMFTLKFDPVALGESYATVVIPNNDPDESPFSFEVTGRSLTPNLDVTCNFEWINGISTPILIANQDFIPAISDCTKFKNKVPISSTPVHNLFYIRNSGEADLEISQEPLVAVINELGNAFNITLTNVVESVSPGGFKYFRINFEPESVGLKSARVVVESNDPVDALYEFSLEAYGKSLLSKQRINTTNQIVEGSVINLEFTLDYPQELDVVINYEILTSGSMPYVDADDFVGGVMTGTVVIQANTNRANLYLPTAVDGVEEGLEELKILIQVAGEEGYELAAVRGSPWFEMELIDGNNSDLVFQDGFD